MDYEFYMKAALKLARKALDAGEFPVGCVITYRGKIIASGERKNSKGDMKNEIDHAEMVALMRLTKKLQKIDAHHLTLYCTMEPCLMCLGAIILSGIREIVFAYEDVMGGGTNCNLAKLKPLYRDNYISIVPNILREKSLMLFKTYFADQANDYWKGSLLAQYTLSR